MASHFSSIGFQLQNREDFARLVMRAVADGETIAAPHGFYYRWAPGAGIELWAQTNQQGQVLGCNPHFAGSSRVRAGVTAIHKAEGSLDASLYASMDPQDDKPGAGLYPFVVDVPDLDLIADQLQCPIIVTLQVAAFAHKLNCFMSDDEYYASQSQKGKVAAESFIPSGLFKPGPSSETPDRPKAMAIFAGHILNAEERTNPVTGHSFYWLNVQSYGAVFDVVADPTIVEQRPVIGGVASGVFWLTGRIMSDSSASS